MAYERTQFTNAAVPKLFANAKVFSTSYSVALVANTFKVYLDTLESAGVLFTSMVPMAVPVVTYEVALEQALQHSLVALTPASFATVNSRTTFVLSRVRAILDQLVKLGYVAPEV